MKLALSIVVFTFSVDALALTLAETFVKMEKAATDGETEVLAFHYSFAGKSDLNFVAWVPNERGSFQTVEPLQEDLQLERVRTSLTDLDIIATKMCVIHSHPQRFPIIAHERMAEGDPLRRIYDSLIQYGAPSSPPSRPDLFYTREFEEMVHTEFPTVKASEVGVVVDALGTWTYRELRDTEKQERTATLWKKLTPDQKRKAREFGREEHPASAARSVWISKMSRAGVTAKDVRSSEMLPILLWSYAISGTELKFRSHAEAKIDSPCEHF